MEHGYDENLATNRYYDRHFDSEAAKILPGEYFVTDSGMLLVTVLGSCVAACIRDTKTGMGGMNHFMLPDVNGAHLPPKFGVDVLTIVRNIGFGFACWAYL